jgi:hypothetical protein
MLRIGLLSLALRNRFSLSYLKELMLSKDMFLKSLKTVQTKVSSLQLEPINKGRHLV